MRQAILKDLIKIANELDQKGYHQEADAIDKELHGLIGSGEEFYAAEGLHDELNREEAAKEESLDKKLHAAMKKAEDDPEAMSELNAFLDRFLESAPLPGEREADEGFDIPFADDAMDKTAAKKKKKPVAKNKKLWARAVAAAKKKFDVYPSRYANHWAVNWYEEKGGKWE